MKTKTVISKIVKVITIVLSIFFLVALLSTITYDYLKGTQLWN